MAKSKPAKLASTRTTKRSARAESLETSQIPDSASCVELPRKPGAISDVEIGHVAGDVWGALIRDGSLTVAALKKSVDAPSDVVMAAVGWLAREDKLDFSTQGRSVKISLR